MSTGLKADFLEGGNNLTNEKWVVGLVRYENSRNWYSTTFAELQEVLFVIEGHQYGSMGAANRVISRWRSQNPRKLPHIEENREKLPNGRYELYRWEPILLDDNGIPGFQYGHSTGYRLLEYPNFNKKNVQVYEKYGARRELWPNNAPNFALWIKNGPYAGQLAVRVDHEAQHGDLGLGFTVRLLDTRVSQGETIILWKGKDY